MAIRCPRNPFRRRRTPTAAAETTCKTELSCAINYKKSAAESNDECPVCLSVFAEGEEIRQLSACKHAFHAACIDKWLSSHSSCPVCRAAVPVKRSKRASIDRGDDFRQGLPDAASLI